MMAFIYPLGLASIGLKGALEALTGGLLVEQFEQVEPPSSFGG